MPSIYYLNPPPNPFWDFVAGIEDHPLFAGHRQPPAHASGENVDAQAERSAQPGPEQQPSGPSEKAKGKQASVEDPPEVDPSTLKENTKTNKEKPSGCGRDMPFRGRGRWGNPTEDGPDGPDGPRRGGCRGRGGHHRGGPPPFMFGPYGPWWARRGPPPDAEGHQGPGPHHGGPPPGFEGHHGHGPHHRGPPYHHRGPHSHSPPRGGPEGFKLGEFLNNLGQRLGVDLSGAAEGLGLDRFTGPRNNNDADFEPRADIFDTPANYIIHLSLPGAKKEDVGVDWDGENSVLRIAGVVHRPGADEQLLSQLVIDGRKRETGVFEKAIRLGTKRDPASIDSAAISAKMTDGVLVVKVPKVEVEHKKRDVPIGSATPSPVRGVEEKPSLIDTDNEMYDAPAPVSHAANEKEAEHQHEIEANKEHDNRSETMDYEHPAEKLPAYEAEETAEEDDWEKAGSEDEGEYVKINVD